MKDSEARKSLEELRRHVKEIGMALASIQTQIDHMPKTSIYYCSNCGHVTLQEVISEDIRKCLTCGASIVVEHYIPQYIPSYPAPQVLKDNSM